MAMAAEYGPGTGKAFAQLAMAGSGRPLVTVRDREDTARQINLDLFWPARAHRVIVALDDHHAFDERRKLGGNAGADIAGMNQQIRARDRLVNPWIEMAVGVGDKCNTHRRGDYPVTASRQYGMLGDRILDLQGVMRLSYFCHGTALALQA